MKIFFVGSGRVATFFSQKLYINGEEIIGVYSRTSERARKLAEKLNCNYYTAIDNIPKADVFILCVKDDAIHEIALSLVAKYTTSLFIHTSGATALSALMINSQQNKNLNIGVLYPLQTFGMVNDKSNNDFINSFQFPLFIEASNDFSLKVIKCLGKKLSTDVYELNSQNRKLMHLAAVFANNFTNHCLALAQRQMQRCNLPFDLLNPIVKTTIEQLAEKPARQLQTGPAERNDMKTLSLHESLLENDIQKKFYQAISKSILDLK